MKRFFLSNKWKLLIFALIQFGIGSNDSGVQSDPKKNNPLTQKTKDTSDLVVPSIPKKRAVVISINREIDPGLAYFIKRAAEKAKDTLNPDVLIFQINTFGGRLDAAFDIVDAITEIKGCSTYAYVKKKAISAGAFIALASNKLVMEKGTEIGDCAPIIQSDKGIIMAGEKIESPLRARFRSLATRNNYPLLLAQAMVSIDMHIVTAKKDGEDHFFTQQQWDELEEKEQKKYSKKKTVVQKGELLTLTDSEAEKWGFSQGSFESLDDFIESKGWEKVKMLETNWSEELVRFLTKISPLLMLIGFGALYMEFKTPGFGLFGFIGIICIAIVFGGKYAAGLANHVELLLLTAGAILVIIEMYVFPGTFIFGGLGVLCMIIALIFSLQSFSIPNPDLPWEKNIFMDNLQYVLTYALISLIIPILAVRYVIPYLPKGMRVIDKETLKQAHAYSVKDENPDIKIGIKGKTKTPLKPIGKIILNNKLVEGHSLSGFIEAGKNIEVSGVEGNKIIVREVT